MTDPEVAHLKLWENSPSRFYAQEYERSRRHNSTRDFLRRLVFGHWEQKAQIEEFVPCTDDYVHYHWLRAIKYNERTYELIEDAPIELMMELIRMPIFGYNEGAPLDNKERWEYRLKYNRFRIGQALSKGDMGRVLNFPIMRLGEEDEGEAV